MNYSLERTEKLRGKEKAVFLICLINGVCAVFFGGVMMLFPQNTPFGLDVLLTEMTTFPFNDIFFQNLFWSGLALLLCNGMCNLIASALFLTRHAYALRWASVAAVLLMIWCIAELVFLPNPAAVFYWFIGLVQLYLSSLSSRRAHSIHA